MLPVHPGVPDAGVDGVVRVLLLLDRLLFLQVLGDDHAGDALLGQRDAERAIDGMPDRGSRRDCGDEIVGHVLEERL